MDLDEIERRGAILKARQEKENEKVIYSRNDLYAFAGSLLVVFIGITIAWFTINTYMEEVHIGLLILGLAISSFLWITGYWIGSSMLNRKSNDHYDPKDEEVIYNRIKGWLKNTDDPKASTIQELFRLGFEDAWHFIYRLEKDGLISVEGNRIKKLT